MRATIAALLILGAAVCTAAQIKGREATKHNTREKVAGEATPEIKAATKAASTEDVTYSYEFRQPQFQVNHIRIKHDANGRGEVSFERQGDLEPIVEPLELSASALARITALWEALRFLDSKTNYQSERQFPHMGTMRLGMKRGTSERNVEFNWTTDPDARALAEEYKRASNQAIFVFDIEVARVNQPLDSPKLLNRLDGHLKRNELSDPKQLIPLLRELNTDERLPLMARNQAERILKKLEK